MSKAYNIIWIICLLFIHSCKIEPSGSTRTDSADSNPENTSVNSSTPTKTVKSCTLESSSELISVGEMITLTLSVNNAKSAIIDEVEVDLSSPAVEKSPTATTTYSASKIDENGVSSSCSVTVNVASVEGDDISAGKIHTCVVKAGKVYCWGNNSYGQLGNSTTTSSLTPVLTTDLDSDVSQISVNEHHSCAVKSGAAYCWGSELYGRLGNGKSSSKKTYPVMVDGLESNITSISTGRYHTCAIQNGGVKCWGWVANGAIGIGSTSSYIQLTPVEVVGLEEGSGVTALTSGENHSCAIKKEKLFCWGLNTNEQIGQSSTVSENIWSIPRPVAGMESKVSAVSAGRFSTCAIQNGAAKCWGLNISNQTKILGIGSLKTNQKSPLSVANLNISVSDISFGYEVGCAIRESKLMCWGRNSHGQSGLVDSSGNILSLEVPVEVESSIVTGSVSAGWYHSCFSSGAGSDIVFKCFGENGSGQLGIDTTINELLPIEIKFDD